MRPTLFCQVLVNQHPHNFVVVPYNLGAFGEFAFFGEVPPARYLEWANPPNHSTMPEQTVELGTLCFATAKKIMY